MNIKVTGVVKHGGAWKRPGDEILGVTDEVGKDMIAMGIAEVLPKSQAEIDAELKAAEELERARLADEQAKAEAKELADKEEADRLAELAKKDAKKEPSEKVKADPKE